MASFKERFQKASFFGENALNKPFYQALIGELNEMDPTIVALLVSVFLAILPSALSPKGIEFEAKDYRHAL